MCGIHGIISGPSGERNADDFLKSAFITNQVRGMDAAGLVVVNNQKNEFDLAKLPVSGQFFINHKNAQGMVRDACVANRLAIGHVRASTTGGNNIDCAHPFECMDNEETNLLVGVHNGTLTGWHSKPDARYYSVDSEWALNHIRAEQFDAFEDFTGSYCFVWWDDKDPDVLNIALNKERPMHVVMLAGGGMAFASEGGMLYWLLERHNIKMDGNILELSADNWYKFPIKNPKGYTKRALPKSVTRTYTPPASSSGAAGWSSYRSAVTKTEELLSKFKKSFTTSATTTPPAGNEPAPVVVSDIKKSPHVSVTEYEAAVALQLLGRRVVFTPVNDYRDGVEGIATFDDSEYSAGVIKTTIQPQARDELWECTIIGVDDTSPDDVYIILAAPSVMTKAAATVH